ncbi:MAG: oligosaccharide flippase family protein, partial [Fibrobacter sp.]|nr:oligosaccharide flippase family protein [Fibrobacter sp.]
MELRKKTYNAVLWSFIDRSGDQLLRFVVGVILARLLLPEHFGIIGMAYIVTEIARIFVQSGFGMALINNSKCNSTDESSVFFFNIIIGALLTLFVFILSPFIA